MAVNFSVSPEEVKEYFNSLDMETLLSNIDLMVPETVHVVDHNHDYSLKADKEDQVPTDFEPDEFAFIPTNQLGEAA